MATAVQKIILSSSRDIPFNKLVLSQSNVRRVKAGISIEDLAASIARRGLIQSLSVVPVVDAEGQETGMFEVPAGGRRFRALELLVKQKRLAKIAPVPCVVRKRDDEVLSEEVSLVENIDRAPLHPLDQFRAFQDMRVKGKTEEEIAAALCRGRHDAGTADGIHRVRRSCATGAGLGCGQELLVQGTLPDPPHADRDRSAGVGQARPFPGARGL